MGATTSAKSLGSAEEAGPVYLTVTGHGNRSMDVNSTLPACYMGEHPPIPLNPHPLTERHPATEPTRFPLLIKCISSIVGILLVIGILLGFLVYFGVLPGRHIAKNKQTYDGKKYLYF